MGTVFDGERFQQLILEKFESQMAFAEKVGVSRQYINQVIKGEVTPSLRRLAQFAELLGVSVDELMGKELALAGAMA